MNKFKWSWYKTGLKKEKKKVPGKHQIVVVKSSDPDARNLLFGANAADQTSTGLALHLSTVPASAQSEASRTLEQAIIAISPLKQEQTTFMYVCMDGWVDDWINSPRCRGSYYTVKICDN